ncbi:MAG: argininosuccinate lyase [Runella slithyformis]|nr:MAG: argininosuccinate lyase [Runella slithyformis]TAF93764.1 MAG: argininosuccinate lyase [Runella sp.]TAG24397.1 MAG: argininosuccinate lyase [Cytophagales bacterium]TAG36421.1 MAG: argininosuccinate lyase [Cytophagia bacterium]TAF00433.1 MAG: argininosuccinate lyase [Runella slithyformis]
MKLWQKENSTTSQKIEKFTVGRDRELDLHLASFDVLGNLAHAQMLQSIGLLDSDELEMLQKELKNIYQQIEQGTFEIEEGVEDIHSQVELMLTRKLGDVGKKIHAGRSRNDQVLVDMKLFTRSRLEEVAVATQQLFEQLMRRAEQHQNDLLPGYTHLQIAMPSSFGLWFGAYAEALVDDMAMLQTAYRLANKNPLGSGAGYGSSFPLNRTLTTQLLGFETLHYNVVYAQMSRGKTEQIALTAIAAVATTLARLSMDVCLYNSQNFGFLTLPDDLTTGSSIMPHKKNPDVAELLRAKTNRLKALPMEITLVMSNLPSGYHRDMQLLKEILMPAFNEILDCLDMAHFMFEHLEVKPNLLADAKYDLLFSVERVNELVMAGVPFRDAYRQVGQEINEGHYVASRTLAHTHEGSIGNLCTDEIKTLMQAEMARFEFEKAHAAIEKLLVVSEDTDNG